MSKQERYFDDSSLENRIQGEWEAVQMKLENVANFANHQQDITMLNKLQKLGYKTVGEVVEAIKNDQLDPPLIQKIFIDDARVCVPIYTSAENYLYRHNLIDAVVEMKKAAGHVERGSYHDKENFEAFNSRPEKKDLRERIAEQAYKNPSEIVDRMPKKEAVSLPGWYVNAKRYIDREYELAKQSGKENPDPHDLHMAMLKFADSLKDDMEQKFPMLNDWVRQYVFRISNFPDWQTNSKKRIEEFLAELEGYLKYE